MTTTTTTTTTTATSPSSLSSSSSSSVARPDNIIERIGRTPLIELASFSTQNVKLYAKLEWFNPFGSVKDRAAVLDGKGC